MRLLEFQHSIEFGRSGMEGMMQLRAIYVLATIALMSAASSASATENVTYTYDALGRLTQSSTTGTVNNGLAAAVSYDAADNRTNYTVTGSANNSLPVVAVVVVPLAGFTIIPITAGVPLGGM
jgi:hypothetical protein